MTLHVERVSTGFADPEESRWNINPFDPQKSEGGSTSKRTSSCLIVKYVDAIGGRLVNDNSQKTFSGTNSLILGIVPVDGSVDCFAIVKSLVTYVDRSQ